MQINDWVLDRDLPLPGLGEGEYTGQHHIGTTRMADDPQRGVVDRDCRVFGLDNLYVAGSSVFPTSSYINPTLPGCVSAATWMHSGSVASHWIGA